MRSTQNTKRRTLAFSLLAAVLIVAIVGTAFNNQQQASAASKPRTRPSLPSNSPFPEQIYTMFKVYSTQFVWKYDYSKSEQQNEKSFANWFYCDDNNNNIILKNDSRPRICPDQPVKVKKNPGDPQSTIQLSTVDLMRYFAVYGESYAYQFAFNKQFVQSPIQFKSLVTEELVRDSQSNWSSRPLITDAAWHVFLKYEQKAFHYNYNKSEKANIKAYQRYSPGKSDEAARRWVWFNEQRRDTVLYSHAVAYVNGVAPIGGSLTPPSPEKVTSSDIRGWIAYSGIHIGYLWGNF